MNSATAKNRTAAKAIARVNRSIRVGKSMVTVEKKGLQAKKNLATLLLGVNSAETNNQF